METKYCNIIVSSYQVYYLTSTSESALSQRLFRVLIIKVNNQANSNFIIKMPSSHPNYVVSEVV